MVLDALDNVSSFFAAARAMHMTACAALASVFVFERLVAGRSMQIPSRRWIVGLALVAIAVSGAAWFAGVTIDMTGLPFREALTAENLRGILGTEFGKLWIGRGVVLLIATIVCMIRRSAVAQMLGLLTSLTLLGSIAWAGHGRFGLEPNTHLVADVGHLLIIAIWPGGLLPLWMMLGSKIDVDSMTAIVNRFSKLALLSVAVLIGTGWINSWMLIASWHGLFDSAYGQTLLIKLLLLAAILLLGAANLLYLRPRIAQTQNAILFLRWTVAVESVLALCMMLVVGYLGMLQPAADL
jgi:putative copper export protein